MTVTARELRARRADIMTKAQDLNKAAELEDRNLTNEEQATFDGYLTEADALEARAKRLEDMSGIEDVLNSRQAPAVNKIKRGDSEIRALAHFVRTGDTSGVSHLVEQDARGKREVVLRIPTAHEIRAVVDSTMNITTAADGANIVPTGFVRDVAMRKAEKMLAPALGCRRVPGKGTTVNYPYEDADPEVFGTTSEQSDAHDQNYERDAGKTGLKAFTLAEKTRKIELTEELMEDEDVGLMDYIAGRIVKQVSGTHNSMLLTEVAANGSALKTYASATAIAAGEPDDFVFNDTLSYYMEEGDEAAWVMRPTTFGTIAGLTGNARLYAETPGGSFAKEILGYPVFYSNKAAATAASAKDVYFGV